MSIYHAPTFLRSALAKDPLCHGGLIQPEEVLRLQAEFPTLFGLPPHPPRVEQPKTQEVPDDDPNSKVEAASCSLIKEKAGSSKNVASPGPLKGKPKVTNPNVAKVTKKSPTVRNPPSVAGSRKAPSISQFHKNCFGKDVANKKDDIKKSMKPIPAPKREVKRTKTTNELLCRPAQSFSLEDLRAALKQVLAEDAYQKNLKSEKNKSPYTEDLVKLFFGRKMQQARNQQRETQRKFNIKDFVKDEQSLDVSSITLRSARSSEPDLTPRSAQGNYKQISPLGRRLGGVRSAPGFLRRVGDFPRAPPTRYQKVRIPPDKITKKESSISRHVTWEPDRESGGGDIQQNAAARCESKNLSAHDFYRNTEMQMQAEWSSHSEDDEVIRSRNKRLSKRLEADGPIFSRSEKRLDVEPTHEHEHNFVKDDRFSSHPSYYHQLVSRSTQANFESKASPRKQTEQKQRQISPFHSRIKHNLRRPVKDIVSDTLICSRELGRDTTQALQKIAEELVHTEIMRQIREFKREPICASTTGYYDDSDESVVKKPPKSPTSSNDSAQKSLPKFIPTTPDQGSSETDHKTITGPRKSSSEIVLKTPDLTPPSAVGRMPNKKNISQNEEAISLHTPQLSPNLPKLEDIQENEEAKQNLVDTDCSEMSEFALSEASNHRKQKSERNSSSKNESLKLDTPQLTKSHHSSKKESPPDQKLSSKGDSPENDHSTLSGVSTFHESSNQRQSKPEKNTSEIEQPTPHSVAESPPGGSPKISGYSDDFIPEDGNLSRSRSTIQDDSKPHASGSATPPVRDMEKFDQSILEIGVDADAEYLNVSEDTVIDNLSEGEFIGAAYRSPGEAGLRKLQQNYRQQRSTSTPSGSTALTESQPHASSKSSASKNVEAANNGSELDNSQISFISSGARVSKSISNRNLSTGEYLQ